MYLSYTTNIKFTLVTDDEFQADNGNCKACDKVVQSYKKKNHKNSPKIYPKPLWRQLPYKSKHRNTIQNMFTLFQNMTASNKTNITQ